MLKVFLAYIPTHLRIYCWNYTESVFKILSPGNIPNFRPNSSTISMKSYVLTLFRAESKFNLAWKRSRSTHHHWNNLGTQCYTPNFKAISILVLKKIFKVFTIYSRTSMARTLMARLPLIFRTRSWIPWKKSHSCRFGITLGVFSSPEPKAPGELIGWEGSVVHPSSVHNFKRLLLWNCWADCN